MIEVVPDGELANDVSFDPGTSAFGVRAHLRAVDTNLIGNFDQFSLGDGTSNVTFTFYIDQAVTPDPQDFTDGNIILTTAADDADAVAEKIAAEINGTALGANLTATAIGNGSLVEIDSNPGASFAFDPIDASELLLLGGLSNALTGNNESLVGMIAQSGNAYNEGDTFTLDDGVNTVTYEFDLAANGVAAGNVPIVLTGGENSTTAAAIIAEAIETSGVPFIASLANETGGNTGTGAVIFSSPVSLTISAPARTESPGVAFRASTCSTSFEVYNSTTGQPGTRRPGRSERQRRRRNHTVRRQRR